MELRARDQAVERDAGVQRDYAVVPPVDDQGFAVERTQRFLALRHRLDMTLARGGKHRGVGFLVARPDAGLVAQPDELVGDDRVVVGEQADQLPHPLRRGLVAPHRVEPRRDLERVAGRPHQHQPVHPLRVGGGQRERQPAAEGVADDAARFDPERIEHRDRVVAPVGHLIGRIRRAFGIAEADDVGRYDPEPILQTGEDRPPVGPRGDPRAGAVQQQDRRPAAPVVQVGRDAPGVDRPPDLGVGHRRRYLRDS